MKAWIIEQFSGIEKARLTKVPDPVPGTGEVILRLTCAALNPADRYLAQGEYPAKPPFPHILGRDGCGVIVRSDADVHDHPIGRKRAILRGEMGVSKWGTFAELVAVPAESLIEVPAGWTDEQAGSATLVYVTAFQALTQWDDLPSQAVVLISGASGGVGVASTQLGIAMGHTVIGLSRGSEKHAALRSMGMALVLDPADAQWRKTLATFLGKRKVDLAIDSVGGTLFPHLIAALGDRGRVSVVGRLAGEVPQFNTATLFFRRIRIGGVAVGAYTNRESHQAWKASLALLNKMGTKPLIDHVFPFDQLPAAFERLAQGPMGKVLIRCNLSESR
ncbi:MAG TPA: zinc-binding alcohol dehydrogenase family protein [Terriglobia bacterium]|nr:zinc-binding alcohol dehydrogenase family protein [Terriglobia bacterium]